MSVIGAHELKRHPDGRIVISIFDPNLMRSVARQLAAMGRPGDLLSSLSLADLDGLDNIINYLEYFEEKWALLAEVSSWLIDSRSRYVYANVVKLRIFPEQSNQLAKMILEGAQYWAFPEFRLWPEGAFLDIGGFTGDTVESFLYSRQGGSEDGEGCEIYSFEPQEGNFQILRENCRLLGKKFGLPPGKIKCLNQALGCAFTAEVQEPYLEFRADKLIRARAVAPLRIPTQGNSIIPPLPGFVPVVNDGSQPFHNLGGAVAMDDMFRNVKVGLIKIDAEGGEMDILRGGAQVIKRDQPLIAVAIYHKLIDLFIIPEYIKSLAPDYKMAVRHHHHKQYDTVLYCWR